MNENQKDKDLVAAYENGKRDSIIEFCEGDRSMLAEYEQKAYDKGFTAGAVDKEKAYAEAYEKGKLENWEIAKGKFESNQFVAGFTACRERAREIVLKDHYCYDHCLWCIISARIVALRPEEGTK